MRFLIILTYILLLPISIIAQEKRVKLAIDVSNSFMYCFTSGRFFDLTTASLGVDIENNNANVQLFGVYGFNTNLIIPSDRMYGRSNFSLKSNLVGISTKILFLNKNEVFRPFLSLSFLSEFKSNYFNQFIDPLTFTPTKTHTRYKQNQTT